MAASKFLTLGFSPSSGLHETATDEALHGLSEVLHMICIKYRVNSRIQMGKNDEGIDQPQGGVKTEERLGSVVQIQRNPTNHEEDHNHG